jgi:hypothetical protein
MFRQRIGGDQPIVRSRALVTPGTSIEEPREIRAKKRPGPQWKACTRLLDSFPSLVTRRTRTDAIFNLRICHTHTVSRCADSQCLAVGLKHYTIFRKGRKVNRVAGPPGIPVMQFGVRTPGSGSHRDETTRLMGRVPVL